jgi:hypothetical protein
MSYKKKLMLYEDGLKQKQILHTFDALAYKTFNPDLQHMSDKEAIRHYKNHGFYEGRKYKNVYLPSDFDVSAYKQLNYDLQHMTDEEAIIHYKKCGIYECRKYKNSYIPHDFDVFTYKTFNPDLQYMTDEEAINHYKNYGFYESRIYTNNLKTAVIFHVGNIDIFLKIYNDYMHFFKRNMLIFVTLHNEDFSEIVKQHIPTAIITIIENKGMDIGGKLNDMKLLINHPNYNDIHNIYFIHTKTNNNWRNELLSPLLNNYIKIEQELQEKNTPIIIGSNKYCYRNKGTNRNYITDIFDRNKDNFNILLKNDWYDYQDQYIFENINIEDSKNIYTDLNVNPQFYKNYETDLKSLSNNEAIEHFDNCGVNEFHRINNPCYLKKFGKESYFIAGTIFMCNKEYFKIFEGINFDYEYSILEPGYVLNNIPRKTHSWEYLFGLLAYCMNGHIISIDEKGIMNDMKNKDTEFNVDIYRNCNMDLNEYSNDELLNDYNTYGMYENKIATMKQLYKQQSIINQDLMKATIAIFIKVVNNSDSFNNVKSILQKIKIMTENTFADIYIGYDLNNDNYYHGLSTIYEDINSQYNIIGSFDIIDITKYNFYLGYNLQRKYDTIIQEVI